MSRLYLVNFMRRFTFSDAWEIVEPALTPGPWARRAPVLAVWMVDGVIFRFFLFFLF
jgi:hypothetical protein